MRSQKLARSSNDVPGGKQRNIEGRRLEPNGKGTEENQSRNLINPHHFFAVGWGVAHWTTKNEINQNKTKPGPLPTQEKSKKIKKAASIAKRCY